MKKIRSTVANAAGPSCAVLVAYHFPPLNVVAAQRGLRIARVLLERYDCVYVIRQAPGRLRADMLDFWYAKEVLEHPRLKCIDTTPWLARRGANAEISLIDRMLGGILTRLFCGPGLEWIPALSKALAAIPPSSDIKVLVASGPPFPPFLVCVRWAVGQNIPVVLDYRDLWSRNPIARYPRLSRFGVNRLLERPLNRAATLLTTVSDGCRATMLGDSLDTPVYVVRNLPDAAYRDFFRGATTSINRVSYAGGGSESKPIRAVLTGQIYPTCTFAPVIRAILELPESAAGRLEIHYFGACSTMIRTEFERLGVGCMLIDHGMVQKAAAIEAVASADLLLSLVHTEAVCSDPSVSGLMTTKVYDYFLSGRPILNIGPNDAELNIFAEEIGYTAFHSYVASDTAGISAFLKRVIAGDEIQCVNPDAIILPDFTQAFGDVLTEAEQIAATSDGDGQS